VEDVYYEGGTQVQLHAYMLAAKRYCLFSSERADPEPKWFRYPAVTRFTFSSPRLLKPLMAARRNRAYGDQVKPFNCVLSVQAAEGGHPAGVDPDRCHLIGPDYGDPRRWTRIDWYDVYTGQRCRITTAGATSPNVAVVRSMAAIVREYLRHPESKNLGPDGRVGFLRFTPPQFPLPA